MAIRHAEFAPHRMTTRHAAALMPFYGGESALSGGRCYIGHNLSHGGSAAFDPWDAYNTTPRLVESADIGVIGLKGSAKSAFFKSYNLHRQVGVFGRQAFMVDPHDEYRASVEAVNGTNLDLYPGGQHRLNPLAPQSLDPQVLRLLTKPERDEAVQNARLAAMRMLHSIAANSIGAMVLNPIITDALTTTLDVATLEAKNIRQNEPTIPQIVNLLKNPPDHLWQATTPAMQSREHFIETMREVTAGLATLVSGVMAGMFDAPTNLRIDPRVPALNLNLRAFRDSAALGIAMTCAVGWLDGTMDLVRMVERSKSEKLPPELRQTRPMILGLDEAYKLVRSAGIGQYLLDRIKADRKTGDSTQIIMQMLSDALSVGDSDSHATQLAKSLITNITTWVVYRQPSSEDDMLRTHLNMNDTLLDYVHNLDPGQALWSVNGKWSLVQHVLHPWEVPLVDTDGRMRNGSIHGGVAA